MKDEVNIAMERIRARKERRAAEIVCKTLRSVAEHKKAERLIKEMRDKQPKDQITSSVREDHVSLSDTDTFCIFIKLFDIFLSRKTNDDR